MSTNVYKLKWKHFNINQNSSLNALSNKNKNADVTLVTDDKVAFPAHKFVLSASSPVLKDLLLDNPHPHPIIYLNSIRRLELGSLLQLIYLGKTQIDQIEMETFYENGRDLQIKLLNQPLIDDDEKIGKCASTFDVPNDMNNDCLMIGNVGDNMPVEESNPRLIEEEDFMKTYRCEKCEVEAFNSLQEVTNHIKNTHESTMYNCGICPYQTSKPSNLRQHKESIHEGVRYSCHSCEYYATRIGSLNMHIKAKHAGIKNQCD